MAGLLSIPRTLENLYTRHTSPCILTPFKHASDSLENGSEAGSPGPRLFQYFPESLSDGKQTNYSQKEVPGGNLPLYQWIAGGERLISFTAIFSSDVDLSKVSPDRHQSTGLQMRNVDVKSALLWLRSFLMPTYGSITQPPRHLLLSIANSGMGMLAGDTYSTHAIRCVMTQCEISLDAWWPNGSPRIATVSLAFAQIAQTAKGVSFPGSSINLEQQVYGNAGPKPNSLGFYGYRLVPTSGELSNAQG